MPDYGAREDPSYETSRALTHDHDIAVGHARRVAVLADGLKHGAYEGCDFFQLLQQEEDGFIELCARLYRDAGGKTTHGRKVAHAKWAGRTKDGYIAQMQKPTVKRKQAPSSPRKATTPKRQRA